MSLSENAGGEPGLELEEIPAPISFQRREIPGGQAVLHWLGQAGFLIETENLRIVIDAYLSDSLAVKYKGREFPHIRMSPPPVDPGHLRDIDFVFSSHAHTDHMDPETIAPLASANPRCTFIVPAAEIPTALGRGVPRDRLVPMDDGDEVLLIPGSRVTALASAHEEREKDALGRDRFLGYVFDFDGLVLYHSGDCVPFPELGTKLARLKPGIFLLPVNGRDSTRSSKGILGNFTLGEAIGLASDLNASFLIGHHFGLFDFNTIDTEKARAAMAGSPESGRLDIRLASPSVEYRFGLIREDA